MVGIQGRIGGETEPDGHAPRWTIGFLAPVVHGYFFGNVLTGVLDAAAVRGCRVIAIQTLDAGILMDSSVDNGVFAQVAWDRVDALIIGQSSVSDEYIREFLKTGKPVISVYRESEDLALPTVVPDNYDGIRTAVDHLIEHGHRRIVFIGRDPADADDAIRYKAYAETMTARGLDPVEQAKVCWHLGQTSDGAAAVRQLMAAGELPTAMVACTDLTAITMIKALNEQGITVPDDMAVIGFDDIADAATLNPPLSTIGQSFNLAGSKACDLAIDALEGNRPAPGLHCTPVTFINRESCGCQPGATEQPNGTSSALDAICEHFTDNLADIVYGEHNLSRLRQQELFAVGNRLVTLLIKASTGNLDQHAATLVETTTEELGQLVAGAPNLLPVVHLIRQLVPLLRPHLGPQDALVKTARLESMACDLSLRLQEIYLRHKHGQPTIHQAVETQRRYDQISTDLVRRRGRDARSLDWLETTEVRAACLALRGEGPERGRNGTGLSNVQVVSTYDRAGAYRTDEESFNIRQFPPASFLDMIERNDSDLLYLLPVKFDGSDWGFLALSGPFNVREDTAYERYNHWAVLLTVGLDQEQATRSERALLEEIRLSEERYALAAEAANDGLWDWNRATGATYYSTRWKAMLGYTDRELPATTRDWFALIHPNDRNEVRTMINQHLRSRSMTVELEHRIHAADGSYRWVVTHVRTLRDDAGQIARLIGSMTDITDRKLLEDRLRHDAHYDALTGLPNRTLFLDRLNRAVERNKRHAEYGFAVVFLDLDGFKVINDSLGHQIGDAVLIQVARRLTDQLRINDTVSRFGGDEFVLLLDDIREAYDLAGTIDRILTVLAEPLVIEDRTLFVSAAAGIAASSSGHRTADEYLRDADTAMYQAKAIGNGSNVLFDDSMHTGAMSRLQMESDLRQAIDDDQFQLFYQPIVRLGDRRMAGLEALIRWRHPSRGLVPPNDFLPVAESTGLIRNLGRWTVRDACHQIRSWLDQCPVHPSMTVSINLSNRQFWDPELRRYVHQALEDYQIPASMLIFEVTEGVIMHNQDSAVGLMRQLRDDGFLLHLDDFGTGYSSLSAVHSFPIDAMKIDRSFVTRMVADARSRELVRVMINMGLNLGIEVIAEGIETEQEASMLADLGCPLVQGYLFSRPVPAIDIPPLFGTAAAGAAVGATSVATLAA